MYGHHFMFFLQVPCVRLIDVGDEMKRYKPEFEGIDEEKLKDYLQDYVDGKLKVFVCMWYQEHM